jgi:hypothetical protein
VRVQFINMKYEFYPHGILKFYLYLIITRIANSKICKMIFFMNLKVLVLRTKHKIKITHSMGRKHIRFSVKVGAIWGNNVL